MACRLGPLRRPVHSHGLALGRYYRVADGRGGAGEGAQRFAPLNSWPDNGQPDKARRPLWPIKQKYGNQISWADLMISGWQCGARIHGASRPLVFAGGREDIWAPGEDTYWGPETKWLASSQDANSRYSRKARSANPLAAVQMGPYVNPEGPDGNPTQWPQAVTCETLPAWPRTTKKPWPWWPGPHLSAKPTARATWPLVGPEPEAAPIEAMGLGWANQLGSGVHTTTSGIEGLKPNPTKWGQRLFRRVVWQ